MRIFPLLVLVSILSGCATIHRHPKLTAAAIITVGAVGGIVAAKNLGNPHCAHYPAGETGNGVPCPVYKKGW